ncbi:DUF6221 family protein [Streptomyces parvus]|uniref:Uncharacterized protein n=1 Tax=Streptomyces parvus TaxID=66428 RepID=A0A7K3RRM0_9ACTN|nr:DUF6221 family protein [Streptomyces parvus]NEC17891.1 hypothetical protein [Streptomyces parvus]
MTARGEDILAYLESAITAREEAALGTLDRVARAAMRKGDQPPKWTSVPGTGEIRDADETATLRVKFAWADEIRHIVANDPASVLRRCAADRKLIEVLTSILKNGDKLERSVARFSLKLLAEGYGWTEGER